MQCWTSGHCHLLVGPGFTSQIRAQNVELRNKRSSFFKFQAASNFVFPNANTKRTKIVEFMLISACCIFSAR